MNIIETKDLSFSYNSVPVLEKISFAMSEGDFTAVLGPNGSGKTTLVKLILGLLTPQKGSVKLFGKQQNKFDGWNNIGYLEQKTAPPALMPISAFETVRLGLLGSKKLFQKFTQADNDAVLKAMKTTGCFNFRNSLFKNLSGGQQQRVLLARTIINNPKLLILDEPSTALDSESRETFFELITNLNLENKTSILLITHDHGEIGKFVNKFLILDKKIIFYGDKQTFCSSKEVGAYMGPYNQHIIDHLHAQDGCCPFHHGEE